MQFYETLLQASIPHSMPVSELAAPPHMSQYVRRPTVPTVVSVEGGVVTSVRRTPLALPIGVGCPSQVPETAEPSLVRPGCGWTLALAFLLSLAGGWAFAMAIRGMI